MAWSRSDATCLKLLIFFLVPVVYTAPLSEIDNLGYYPVSDKSGCYYNFQHYDEGDRIFTNEPCLNCTCHNKMLMCYLRVCPFIKAYGENCRVEKRADLCCPIITCPEVHVPLLGSNASSQGSSETAVGHPDSYGCSIDGLFYADGVRIPGDPSKPCELCYCIRNKTACVMQECTLKIQGCTPVYHKDICCPIRYNCDQPDSIENSSEGKTGLIFTTTSTTTTTTSTTTTMATTTELQGTCTHNGEWYADGAQIPKEKPCESCYCMKGHIVCAVQECAPTPLEKINCTALPPRDGECCPHLYECNNISEDGLLTTEVISDDTTAPTKDLHGIPLVPIGNTIPPRGGQVTSSESENSSDQSISEDKQSTEYPEIEERTTIGFVPMDFSTTSKFAESSSQASSSEEELTTVRMSEIPKDNNNRPTIPSESQVTTTESEPIIDDNSHDNQSAVNQSVEPVSGSVTEHSQTTAQEEGESVPETTEKLPNEQSTPKKHYKNDGSETTTSSVETSSQISDESVKSGTTESDESAIGNMTKIQDVTEFAQEFSTKNSVTLSETTSPASEDGVTEAVQPQEHISGLDQKHPEPNLSEQSQSSNESGLTSSKQESTDSMITERVSSDMKDQQSTESIQSEEKVSGTTEPSKLQETTEAKKEIEESSGSAQSGEELQETYPTGTPKSEQTTERKEISLDFTEPIQSGKESEITSTETPKSETVVPIKQSTKESTESIQPEEKLTEKYATELPELEQTTDKDEDELTESSKSAVTSEKSSQPSSESTESAQFSEQTTYKQEDESKPSIPELFTESATRRQSEESTETIGTKYHSTEGPWSKTEKPYVKPDSNEIISTTSEESTEEIEEEYSTEDPKLSQKTTSSPTTRKEPEESKVSVENEEISSRQPDETTDSYVEKSTETTQSGDHLPTSPSSDQESTGPHQPSQTEKSGETTNSQEGSSDVSSTETPEMQGISEGTTGKELEESNVTKKSEQDATTIAGPNSQFESTEKVEAPGPTNEESAVSTEPAETEAPLQRGSSTEVVKPFTSPAVVESSTQDYIVTSEESDRQPASESVTTSKLFTSKESTEFVLSEVETTEKQSAESLSTHSQEGLPESSSTESAKPFTSQAINEAVTKGVQDIMKESEEHTESPLSSEKMPSTHKPSETSTESQQASDYTTFRVSQESTEFSSSGESHSTPNSTPEKETQHSEEFQTSSTTAVVSSDRGSATTEFIPKQSETTEDRIVPGEGSCLVDGVTYENNADITPINQCQISCRCINSIVKCESVSCDPPAANLQNCMAVYQGPDSCCPIYNCASPGDQSMESDSQKKEKEKPQLHESTESTPGASTESNKYTQEPNRGMEESTSPTEAVTQFEDGRKGEESEEPSSTGAVHSTEGQINGEQEISTKSYSSEDGSFKPETTEETPSRTSEFPTTNSLKETSMEDTSSDNKGEPTESEIGGSSENQPTSQESIHYHDFTTESEKNANQSSDGSDITNTPSTIVTKAPKSEETTMLPGNEAASSESNIITEQGMESTESAASKDQQFEGSTDNVANSEEESETPASTSNKEDLIPSNHVTEDKSPSDVSTEKHQSVSVTEEPIEEEISPTSSSVEKENKPSDKIPSSSTSTEEPTAFTEFTHNEIATTRKPIIENDRIDEDTTKLPLGNTSEEEESEGSTIDPSLTKTDESTSIQTDSEAVTHGVSMIPSTSKEPSTESVTSSERIPEKEIGTFGQEIIDEQGKLTTSDEFSEKSTEKAVFENTPVKEQTTISDSEVVTEGNRISTSSELIPGVEESNENAASTENNEHASSTEYQIPELVTTSSGEKISTDYVPPSGSITENSLSETSEPSKENEKLFTSVSLEDNQGTTEKMISHESTEKTVPISSGGPYTSKPNSDVPDVNDIYSESSTILSVESNKIPESPSEDEKNLSTGVKESEVASPGEEDAHQTSSSTGLEEEVKLTTISHMEEGPTTAKPSTEETKSPFGVSDEKLGQEESSTQISEGEVDNKVKPESESFETEAPETLPEKPFIATESPDRQDVTTSKTEEQKETTTSNIHVSSSSEEYSESSEIISSVSEENESEMTDKPNGEPKISSQKPELTNEARPADGDIVSEPDNQSIQPGSDQGEEKYNSVTDENRTSTESSGSVEAQTIQPAPTDVDIQETTTIEATGQAKPDEVVTDEHAPNVSTEFIPSERETTVPSKAELSTHIPTAAPEEELIETGPLGEGDQQTTTRTYSISTESVPVVEKQTLKPVSIESLDGTSESPQYQETQTVFTERDRETRKPDSHSTSTESISVEKETGKLADQESATRVTQTEFPNQESTDEVTKKSDVTDELTEVTHEQDNNTVEAHSTARPVTEEPELVATGVTDKEIIEAATETSKLSTESELVGKLTTPRISTEKVETISGATDAPKEYSTEYDASGTALPSVEDEKDTSELSTERVQVEKLTTPTISTEKLEIISGATDAQKENSTEYDGSSTTLPSIEGVSELSTESELVGKLSTPVISTEKIETISGATDAPKEISTEYDTSSTASPSVEDKKDTSEVTVANSETSTKSDFHEADSTVTTVKSSIYDDEHSVTQSTEEERSTENVNKEASTYPQMTKDKGTESASTESEADAKGAGVTIWPTSSEIITTEKSGEKNDESTLLTPSESIDNKTEGSLYSYKPAQSTESSPELIGTSSSESAIDSTENILTTEKLPPPIPSSMYPELGNAEDKPTSSSEENQVSESDEKESDNKVPTTVAEKSGPAAESTTQSVSSPTVNESEVTTKDEILESESRRPPNENTISGETATTSTAAPITASPAEKLPSLPDYQEPDYEENGDEFGPGTCRYGGKVYVSAQQIPRDDPCDFCFCFRSDIICLQQSCPPPIRNCHQEPIRGFCCPRYECPVNMATSLNVTTTTTTTTTTLPPHFLSHAYKGKAVKAGCLIKGQAYQVGDPIPSASGPCLQCICGGHGQMECNPVVCSPNPMLEQMLTVAATSKRRR